ncbi:hypothetical protein GCM10022224_028750 [Nonomuraea antimicrobica]|uniref:Uncharacterized protein n=1 Tax=Nonomuraea antimicrobica TaxID=561173 RepID=A0ABP7BNR4_9ACTN
MGVLVGLRVGRAVGFLVGRPGHHRQGSLVDRAFAEPGSPVPVTRGLSPRPAAAWGDAVAPASAPASRAPVRDD